MTSNRVVSLITVFILMIGGMIEATGLPNAKQSLVVVGTVIAYDQLLPLTNITSAPQSQLLLVHIERRIKGRETAQYVKVVYKYGIDEALLPETLFDGKSQWRFTLTRDRTCDSSVGEMKVVKKQESGEIRLPRLKFRNETKGLADNIRLPCYILKPGNYRTQN